MNNETIVYRIKNLDTNTYLVSFRKFSQNGRIYTRIGDAKRVLNDNLNDLYKRKKLNLVIEKYKLIPVED